MTPSRSNSLYLLAALVLVLTSAPRARLDIGAPLYLIDVLALLTLVSTAAQPGVAFVGRSNRLMFLTMVFIGCIAIAQTNIMMSYGVFKEGVYIFGRYMMAISVIWTVPKIINSKDDLLLIIKMVCIGVIISSVITIGVSLPPTRGFMLATVIDNPLLEPSADRTLEKIDTMVDEDEGSRGQSLIGNSTMTGGFLNGIWALTLIGIGGQLFHQRALLLPRIACLLGAAGAIATYGRGAILGLCLAIIGVMLYGQSSLRRNILVAVVALVGIVVSVGVDSEWFFFDRIQRRTEAVLQGDFSDDNEAGRIAALTEPFVYMSMYPESIVIGRGNTRGKGGRAGRAAFNYHNTPAAAYHFFGLVGAVAHTLLLFVAMMIAYSGSRRTDISPFLSVCYRSLVIGLVAMLPWWALGHATASVPRAVMLYFLILGLVAAIDKLAWLEPYQQAATMPAKPKLAA